MLDLAICMFTEMLSVHRFETNSSLRPHPSNKVRAIQSHQHFSYECVAIK